MSIVLKDKESELIGDKFSLSNEINLFIELVSKSKIEIKFLAMELRQIEKDINILLDNHYHSMNENQDELKDESNISMSENILIFKANSASNEIATNLVDKLYKKLYKICNITAQNTEVSLNSYTSKNIEELTKIEQYLSGEVDEAGLTPKERLEQLADQYDNALEKLKIMKFSSSTKDIEPALQRQILWDKMCSEELVNKIRQDLSKELIIS